MNEQIFSKIQKEQLSANLNHMIENNFEIVDSYGVYYQITELQKEILGLDIKINDPFKFIEVVAMEQQSEFQLLETLQVIKFQVADLELIQQNSDNKVEDIELYIDEEEEYQYNQNLNLYPFSNSTNQEIINKEIISINNQAQQFETYKQNQETKYFEKMIEFNLDQIKSMGEPIIEFNSFLKYLFLREYNQNSVVPKLPNRFSSAEQYKELFKLGLYNENYCLMMTQLQQFQQARYYLVQMKYDENLINKDGTIFQLNIQQQNNTSNTNQKQYLSYMDFYNYKNHILIISSEKTLSNLQQINSKQSSNMFFGFFVDHQGGQNKFKLLTFTKAQSCFNQWINAYIFPFIKISTQIKELIALENIENFCLCQKILDPNFKEIQGNESFNKNTNDHYEILKPILDNIETKFNSSQFTAIKEIALLEQGISLLQGPPGTGKTNTLIGLVSCLYKLSKQQTQKILICAPSNSAIDTIINRILKDGLFDEKGCFTNSKLLRIGRLKDNQFNSTLIQSVSIEWQAEQIVQKDSKYQNIDVDKQQKIKNKQKYKQLYNKVCEQLIGQAEIICSTLGSSFNETMNKYVGKFSVVIIDEAAQCTEPNSIIPLRLGVKKLVLIGDHKQLPATTFSQISITSGFARSLFERFLNEDIKIHFLNIQYCMDPQISQFASTHFYDNKVLDDRSTFNRNQYQDFFQKKCLFLDLQGQEQKYQTSYQNERESYEIVNFIVKIKQRFQQLSLGVICAYKAQAQLIQQQLQDDEDYYDVNVNTIDSFQGQERDIILLSCVRSRIQDSIGFLSDERRINVAITRARFALFIFGNSTAVIKINHISYLKILHGEIQSITFNKNSQNNNVFESLILNNQDLKQLFNFLNVRDIRKTIIKKNNIKKTKKQTISQKIKIKLQNKKQITVIPD